MLIFEITKTNTPLPQKGLAPILIAPPHTYIRIPGNDSSVKQSKSNVYSPYREETKQPRRPIAGLPLLEFSPALESWSDIYTGSYFLPYRNTLSTPDVSGAASGVHTV